MERNPVSGRPYIFGRTWLGWVNALLYAVGLVLVEEVEVTARGARVAHVKWSLERYSTYLKKCPA